MSLLETIESSCPYCGEPIELLVDGSAGDQEYIEDCFVCCRPIVVTLSVDEDQGIALYLRSENE